MTEFVPDPVTDVRESLSKDGSGIIHSTSVRLRPVRDQIVVERVMEETTKGGLFIPESVDEARPRLAKVVAVGPGLRDNSGQLVPVSCQPGDTIVYRRFGGLNDIQVGARSQLLMAEADVLAVVEPIEQDAKMVPTRWTCPDPTCGCKGPRS